MKEHPILFSSLMVRALLDGTKTVTRRIVKPQPDMTVNGLPLVYVETRVNGERTDEVRCPYGAPGESTLWVRETWRTDDFNREATIYRADIPGDVLREAGDLVKWRPSIFMPRVRSRILLAVESVRVERLHNITDEDARAEGVGEQFRTPGHEAAWTERDGFMSLWREINGAESWDANPFVWVIGFKVQS